MVQVGGNMLDTMKLNLQNWKVNNGASLQITGGNTNYKTGEVYETCLFTDSAGHEAFGAKAIFNTDKFQLTIKPYKDNVFALIQFSVPKIIGEGSNYYPIKESQLSEALGSVENELHENGIDTNIQEAKLSRVDTFKNILTDEETVSYSRLFGLLQANRAKDKKTYGATGWLMQNKSTEYCIYDKLEELKNTGHSIDGLEKTLRFEHRCMKPQKVKGFFQNVTTVEELKTYGWSAIQERTVKAWKDNFFKYDFEEIDVLVESQIRTELEYFQAKYGRRFFSMYLKAVGAYSITSSGSVEAVKRALENMDIEDKRKKIYRAERELTQTLVEIQSLRNDSTSPQTLGELYSELKYKMEKV